MSHDKRCDVNSDDRDLVQEYNCCHIMYMDKVDFDEELGKNLSGSKLFPSEESLRKKMKCVSRCGIVKVKVSFLEVVDEGTIKEYINNIKQERQL